MLKTILIRCLQIIPSLFVVVTLTFVLTRMIPGDPARAVLGPQASVEDVEKMRETMGLNQPLAAQYKDYMINIVKGDFGTSYSYNQPVFSLIARRIPSTLLIALPAVLIALIAGLFIGVTSAVHQGTLFDYVFMILALVGVSMPIFWLGLMLVLVFSVNLGWLPVLGMGDISKGLGDVIRHMVLPCFCLATIPMATFSRITRSSILESIHGDSIRALRARGIKESVVIWKYALKSALPPLITVLGLQLAGCFAGAILTETIFSWPGMGTLIVGAIDNRDYVLIQGAVLVIALAFVMINMFVDVIYMIINPNVNYEGGY
ncbi:ABC transporter permease [Lacrimispora sp.]|jgi:peptide/nickel transport system permease protein|uniref:ABC transporter permease n=1 Tax=Lacrimispora sp. TaxID=2719234 RepID=UPI002898596C|nr:ABC transporter permease [Lacrimispora sp.]